MIISLCKKDYDALTDSERAVVDYINQNESLIPKLSITQLAEFSYTSPATISKTIRKCGFNGISELRYKISALNDYQKESFLVNDILEKSYSECTRTIENICITDILKIISYIKNANKIYIMACGVTALVAQEFEIQLQLQGYNAYLISDSELMKKTDKLIGSHDLLIIFTVRNSKSELAVAASQSRCKGAHVVTCSCIKNTSLDDLSDIIVYGFSQTIIPNNSFGVTSRLPLQIIARTIIEYLAV